jgi:hypothetical protein
MAGEFQLFMDEESKVRFRMIGPDGSVLAVSRSYPDTKEAAAGVAEIRECAGTGLISNLCPGAARETAAIKGRAGSVEAAGPSPAMPVSHARAGMPQRGRAA